jgi:uncharacterized protein YndB with AHSA1/START domain
MLWSMKPIVVSTTVDRPREEVFAFLDVLANHEPFTNHMLIDWAYEGPAAGVGAKARMRPNAPNSNDWIDMEVVAARAPESIVEESVGARGKRRTRGTYTLRERPDGGTDVRFELVFLETPRGDRLAAPLLRAWLKRANAKAMHRLRKSL